MGDGFHFLLWDSHSWLSTAALPGLNIGTEDSQEWLSHAILQRIRDREGESVGDNPELNGEAPGGFSIHLDLDVGRAS